MDSHDDAAQTTSSRAPGGTKKWLIGALLGLVSAAVCWGWGFSQGRAALSAQRTGYERRLTDAGAQREKAEAELARAMNRSCGLEARALLLRAAIDLERRNFGTANTRLREAATALQPPATAVASSGQNAGMVALQNEISATNLAVAADVEEQRERVLEFATRLERLTPAASQKPNSPAADSSVAATGEGESR
jgi:hypothetical protein